MNLALINIKQLITVRSNGHRVKLRGDMRELGIIENAAVLVNEDTIYWVGRMEDLGVGDLHEVEVVDCIENVVMPGFIDAHTHLVFAGSREDEFSMRSSGSTYAEIALKGGGILNTVQHVRSAQKKELKKNARKYLNALLRNGTTTVEIKSGYGLNNDDEIKMLEAINELKKEEVIGIVPTFLGAHAYPPEFLTHKEKYVTEILEKMLPYIASHHLAEFCDVFCEKGFFEYADTEKILATGKNLGMQPKIHAEELTPSRGSLIAASVGAVSADHLEHITEEGITALANAGVVAVLLPGVSFFLNHCYAPARELITNGVPVAIATDFNPGSCMSYSMPMMMTIACTHMGMSPEEAITAATLNAAAAINRSDSIGSIEKGKKADFVVLDIPNYKFLPYHFGENHVEKVIKDGVVLEF
ncbi:MAG: imidazolonepropionase [Bacteroidota bacterium]